MSTKLFETEQGKVDTAEQMVVRVPLAWNEVYGGNCHTGPADKSVQNVERPRFGHKT